MVALCQQLGSCWVGLPWLLKLFEQLTSRSTLGAAIVDHSIHFSFASSPLAFELLAKFCVFSF